MKSANHPAPIPSFGDAARKWQEPRPQRQDAKRMLHSDQRTKGPPRRPGGAAPVLLISRSQTAGYSVHGTLFWTST